MRILDVKVGAGRHWSLQSTDDRDAAPGTTAPAGSGYKVRIRRVGSAEPHGESPNGFAINNFIHLKAAGPRRDKDLHGKDSRLRRQSP